MKVLMFCLGLTFIFTLLFEGQVRAASWTCYDAGEGATFCSSSVLDLAVYGGGFSNASQCAAFCNPY